MNTIPGRNLASSPRTCPCDICRNWRLARSTATANGPARPTVPLPRQVRGVQLSIEDVEGLERRRPKAAAA
jgi:hypothetical protein